MKTVLYVRVSTTEQTSDHQRTHAEEKGFKIDAVVADHGISGVSTRLAERPEGRRLFDLLRASDVLVVRWVDRLGRNYLDVRDVMQEFMRRGVIVRTVINGLTFDGATKDPMQMAVRDAQIGFLAALGEAQAEATREAQRAGISHAKATGVDRVYKGRKPSYTEAQFKAVRDMLGMGTGTSEIARVVGLSRQTVLRIKADPAGGEKILAAWKPKSKPETGATYSAAASR